MLPEKYLGVAVLVFALASTCKDALLKLADWMDDGQINGSFTESKPPVTPKITALVALGLAALMFTGCAAIEPGQRAVVVRAEQSLSIADATFDTAVHIDAANRSFYKTNAPAFHEFCQWLRTPSIIAPLTNAEPRGVALVRSANAVKNRYKASGGTNDYAALINSLAIIESATAEAQKFILATQTTK